LHFCCLWADTVSNGAVTEIMFTEESLTTAKVAANAIKTDKIIGVLEILT
jgi:hypothetical protein